MKLLITLIALLMTSPFAAAFGEDPVNVSVNAKGDDVRSVLHEVFTSSKKSYVLEPGVRFVLYMSLKDVELEEALTLICKQANLTYELQNGIYFVSRAPQKQATPIQKVISEPKKPEKPKGTLPTSVLSKKVTTRLSKVDLRALFDEFGKQTGITIEFGADIPSYKLDAYLIGTSLKYALDNVTKATGLTYSFTDNMSIAIRKAEDPNRIVVHKG